MGSGNTNINVKSVSGRIVDDLIELRKQSRNFIRRALFTGSEKEWVIFDDYKLVQEGNVVDAYKFSKYVSAFSGKQTATAWCILDSNGKKDDARSLKYHDGKRIHFVNNIRFLRNQLSNCHDFDTKEIINAKITNEEHRLNSTKKQIDKLISLAKYFQRRGFKYEIV